MKKQSFKVGYFIKIEEISLSTLSYPYGPKLKINVGIWAEELSVISTLWTPPPHGRPKFYRVFLSSHHLSLEINLSRLGATQPQYVLHHGLFLCFQSLPIGSHWPRHPRGVKIDEVESCQGTSVCLVFARARTPPQLPHRPQNLGEEKWSG